MNVFIIHGSYGSPEENWIPWLKAELEKSCKVFVPKFPTPENQSLESWMKVFEDYKVHKNSIFVGHSLGSAFILNILEKLDKPIKAAFFVAGFIGRINNSYFDGINKTFMHSFDWKKIKRNCRKFYIFHSDNDPYVPLEKAEELAENLGVKVILVKGAGHFNKDAGYNKFDILLEKIKPYL